MTVNAPLALVTGASRGLGAAVAHALTGRGWHLIVDGRDRSALAAATDGVRTTRAIPGDVSDPAHRAVLAAAVAEVGRLDLLVNNASTLGRSPLPPLAEMEDDVLSQVLTVNTVAPLALTRLVLPQLLAAFGTVVNVSSDAAVEPYSGWGGYAASKAALDQASAVLAVEQPDLSVYAVDPGDMRTQMQAEAFPGEDISDRPLPETVVPRLLRLLDDRPPSGRYRLADLPAGVAA